MTKFTKQQFLSTVKSNIHNSFNSEYLMDSANTIFDTISKLGFTINYHSSYRDRRFFEIKNSDKEVIGQIFATKNKFLSYFRDNKCLLIQNVEKTKNSNTYNRRIIYKELETIEEAFYDDLIPTVKDEHAPIVICEFEEKYIVPHQVSSTEFFDDGHIVKSKAVIYNFDTFNKTLSKDTYEGEYTTDDNNLYQRKMLFLCDDGRTCGDIRQINSDELNTCIPSINVSNITNGKIKFNIENYIKNPYSIINSNAQHIEM